MIAVGAAVAGCGSSAPPNGGLGGSAPDESVLGLLRLVPANGGMVTVNLYQQAATSAGIQPLAAHADTNAIAGYFSSLNQRAGVPGSDLTTLSGADTTGVDLGEIQADVTAGNPPDDAIAAVGTFDTTAIDQAAHADQAWKSALSTAQYDGVTVYRWLPDNQEDINRDNGILSQIPGSRRLAVSGGRTLLLARNDATMHKVLDAVTNPASSYANNPDAAQVAGQLDRMHAYAAVITTQQPTVASAVGQQGGPEQIAALRQRLAGQLLKPYRMAGIGVTQLHGKPAMLVVLVNADHATAQANATALSAAVTHGTSVRENEPWSSLLAVADVSTDGNLTIATITENSAAGMWFQIVQSNDSLLVRS